MLTGCQNVPCILFMQISTAIINKFVFHNIFANKTHNGTNKVSTPRFSWSKIIIRLLVWCMYVYLVLYLIGGKILCKLVPSLSRNLFFTISLPIIHILEQIRRLHPGFHGQRLASDYFWDAFMCIWYCT